MIRYFASPVVAIVGWVFFVSGGLLLVILITLTFNGHEDLLTKRYPFSGVIMSSVLLIGIVLRTLHQKATS